MLARWGKKKTLVKIHRMGNKVAYLIEKPLEGGYAPYNNYTGKQARKQAKNKVLKEIDFCDSLIKD